MNLARPKADAATYSLKSFSILVVDGSQFMSSVMVSILKALNVGKVRTAPNGRAAIDLLEATYVLGQQSGRFDIDIILCDWAMEGSGGSDVLRWVRGHKDDMVRFLPVVVVSGHATMEVVGQARDLGANEFVGKPFSVNSFTARLLAVIDRPRPFVKAPGFFGPDRRRKVEPIGFEDRRKADAAIEVHHEN